MKRWTVGRRIAAALAFSLLAVGGLLEPAQAQPAPGGFNRMVQIRAGQRAIARNAPGEDELLLDGVFLPPDRTAKRRLDMADEMLKERRFGEAARLLGSLLENPEDFFFKPDPEQPVYSSLKAEAGRLIAGMSSEGRESYELQYGARARQMLKEATEKGDMAGVADVSRRFFFSQAGAEATFLLGRHHLDGNRPLAAAMCFERLRSTPLSADRLEPVLSLNLATCWLRAGQRDKAQETLTQLKQRLGSSSIQLAGNAVRLFTNDAEALVWMENHFGPQRPVQTLAANQWAMFRGDESRNAPSVGGQPLLNVRWRQRTPDDRAVEKVVSKVRQDYLNQEIVALPSMHPLAVGDVVLMRTAFGIQAVDFENGKLVWKYSDSDDALEQFLKAGSSQQAGLAQQVFAGLDQRMWEDATYGTLSSDGAQVYYIDDLGLAGVNSSGPTTVLPRGQRRTTVNTRGTNRLIARELRTQGKLKWEVGGLTGEDEPKLAGAYFLGPPLPLMGKLYVLAEIKGQEIRLVVLSPESGALEWSQQLAVVDPPVTQDAFRRNAGATPSFADGVLVCPTSAGAVVAIDLTTRSLLWGYQYPRVQQFPGDRFNARLTIYPGTERRANERWADGSLTIAGGRVLLTPVETDQLFCLNLMDGKEVWKQPRGNHLYIGCVHDGNVFLVGRKSVSALRLADGEKAYDEVPLPEGSMPSGRGFYSGTHYYLPLTTAEVAKINLTNGQIEQRTRSRSGNIPGNLIAYRGSVISQGVEQLDVFHQLESLKEQIAKTLEKEPDNPAALASLGEVKLDQGELAEAVNLFRRSNALKPDETTREQLIESLLEGLRADFASYRDNLDNLDRMIDSPQHRLTFLRLKAQGLQANGQVMPAFETYMKLVDYDAPLTLDAVDTQLSVRRDRWIGAQLEKLRNAGSSDDVQAMDAIVASRLNTALEAGTADALRGFISLFAWHPLAGNARESLFAALGDGDLLERNLLLTREERSGDERRAARAAARMAKLLQNAGRTELAAIYYRQLAGRFAEVVCRGEKTGQQLVAELPADSPIKTLLAAAGSWPRGKVLVKEDKGPARGTRGPQLPRGADLDIVGPTDSLMQGVSVSIVYDPQPNLVAQDGLGGRRFRIPLAESGQRRVQAINRGAYNAPSLAYVSTNGGLVVLWMGTQLLALDTLRSADQSGTSVLWTQELNDQVGNFATSQGILARPLNVPWGGARFVPEDAFGRRMGSIGPVNEHGVTFQRLHDLHCIDPLTGKTIWIRKNVGLGNDLFGDDELLFVCPAAGGEALVLRASTGELLEKRNVSPFNQRVATLGRRVLTWTSQGAQQQLEMRDLWKNESLWSYTFKPGSKAAVLSQEVIGVLQTDGQFSLISLADGKQLTKEQLEPENTLLGIYLLRSPEGYLLVSNTSARGPVNVTVQSVPNAANSPLVSGHIYAFERETGKKQWDKPVKILQQGLLLSQPSDLPVLSLVRQVHRPSPVNAREPRVSVTCIDKRTGRVVYENDQLPGTTIANYEVSGDAAARTVTLTLSSKTISLTYTDEPLETGTAEAAGAGEEKLIGRVDPSPPPAKQEE